MSSGSLPLVKYHRANCLGSGTYGDVLTVYNDDGNGYAIKVFQPDDTTEEGDSDSSSLESYDENENKVRGMDLGAQREISILRLLRDQNSHPNIIEIHDFKQQDGICEEENGEGDGDELMSNMGLVMPLYPHGNLSDAIDSTTITKKKSKVMIAHGILCAVAFLHTNGIIHRDIKGDNIMIQYGDTGEPCPILIDFSLAKIVEPQVYLAGSPIHTVEKIHSFSTHACNNETTHTPSMGTPTYKAPEVVSQQPYHLPSDMYSVGVVLLELLIGKTLDATKDKESTKVIKELLHSLPDQPFPNLIKGLLEPDPKKRLTSHEALENPLFAKFGLTDEIELQKITLRRIDIRNALPFDDGYDEEDDENDPSNDNKNTINDKSIKSAFPQKRLRIIRRIAHELGSENPYTLQAACVYSEQLSQLENCDDLNESQALCDCVVLAHQFFESEVWSLQAIEELNSGVFREFDWCSETYVDTEETIFMLMDFCLYPRELLDITS